MKILKYTLYEWCVSNNRYDVLKEWNVKANGKLGPKDYASGSNKAVWWKCQECGNEWQMQIVKRTIRNYGCPICGKKKRKKTWMNSKLKKNGSLLHNNPEIAKEWHPTKNLLTPDNVVSGSNKKVWWKCQKCGNEWQAQICKRTVRNQGCPICGKEKGKKAWMNARLKKSGSLVDDAKFLLKEWHPTKNGNLKPNQYLSGSNKKVWWKCEKCGYEWQAVISNRVKGVGCPRCGQNQAKKTLLKNIIAKKGSLLDNNPDLAEEWHPTKNGNLKASQCLSSSNKKVWWKCKKCGYEWQAIVAGRNQGDMCPRCRAILGKNHGSKPFLGINDLLSQNPKLAEEWHPTKNGKLLPRHVTQYSGIKVWWLGKCGHEWQATVASRNSGRNCPLCLREYKVSFPEKVIFFYLRKILFDCKVEQNYKADWLSGKEIDIYIHKYKLGVEYDGYKWHEDLSKDIEKDKLCSKFGITLIRIREDKAPIYFGESKIFLVKPKLEKDLISAISFIIEFINDKYNTEYVVNTNINEDRIQIYELLEMSKKKLSLAILYPDIASEWHPTKNGNISPEYVSAHSHRKVWWLGKCGHEYDMVIKNRTEQGANCPYCSNHRVLKGFNDLNSVNPKLAEEWHPTKNGDIKPSDVTQYSNRKVWWVCKNGHSYKYSIAKRSQGRKCPICSGRRLMQGINDLVTVNKDIADEWNYSKNINILPNEFTSISGKKVWWKCKNCGNEWQTSISNRFKLGRGCPQCARKGRKLK